MSQDPKIETCHFHELRIQKTELKMEAFCEDFVEIKEILQELRQGLRKQEDKSIVYDLIKIGIGITLGLIITNYVGQFLTATREEKVYKVQSK